MQAEQQFDRLYMVFPELVHIHACRLHTLASQVCHLQGGGRAGDNPVQVGTAWVDVRPSTLLLLCLTQVMPSCLEQGAGFAPAYS